MGISDRLFRTPRPDLEKISARLALLPPRLSATIEHAGDALAAGDLRIAQALLANALSVAPGQPDVLRLYGLLLALRGNLHAAFVNFDAALRAAPDDAMAYWQYARVCEQHAGDVEAAWRVRERAVQRLPDSPLALADIGEHLVRHGQPERALTFLEQAAHLAPEYAPAQLTLGNALVSCGRIQDGATAMRRAIEAEPAFGAAWLNLVDIKTIALTDAELDQLRGLLSSGGIDPSERTAIEFALARVCEDRGEYREAFELFASANARRKREIGPWDADEFLTQVKRTDRVFTEPHEVATDPQLGAGVIFIVGMPRSGTTLVEQILASHSDVQGLGERGDVAQVLTEESSRRQRRYPEWVSSAAPNDWQRLGERYLELTLPVRLGPRFTDKLPGNWRALGAIRAMLPGARIVICRRDPLENCWSCFKQFFTSGWEFTYDMGDLATFWRAFDRTATQWVEREPGKFREQGYEVLTEEPEREVRGLLDFCGLSFDPACVAFHQSRRRVLTLSAAQVRQPMHRHADIAAAYGAILDPLRVALGMLPFPSVGNAGGR